MPPCGQVFDRQLIELFFQCAEQPFNAAVLPWHAWLAELLSNAKKFQRCPEQERMEEGFIIGPDRPRHSILTNRAQEVAQDGDCALVRQGLQAQGLAAAMINDAKDGVDLSGGIGFAG